jgi:hypothetical protein
LYTKYRFFVLCRETFAGIDSAQDPAFPGHRRGDIMGFQGESFVLG